MRRWTVPLSKMAGVVHDGRAGRSLLPLLPLRLATPLAAELCVWPQIAKNAPIAVRQAKAAMNEGIDVDMDAAIAIECDRFGECFETADQKEGMAAFLEKRKHEPFQNK